MMAEPKIPAFPKSLCPSGPTSSVGFQGRWSDGWISRVYPVSLAVPTGIELELQINGRHLASDTVPLHLKLFANDLDLGVHELVPGPFRLRLSVNALAGKDFAHLTLECDAAWQPSGGGDDRQLACLIDAIRVIDKNAIGYFGDYSSWEEALSESDGYGAPIVFDRTRAALLQVKNGTAVHERDSVLFPKVEHNFALLAGLLQAVDNGELSVLDFGGSLGSSYFQCRPFLASLKSVRWSIVEQPAYVECGRREFADERLRFYRTVEECLENESPQVLLLSGVIHCLADPYGFLAGVLTHRFSTVIVDRTAFLSRGVDRLTVERVPEWIYPASYPSWFLSEERFLAHFHEGYELVSDFPALDTNQPEGESGYYKGYIFRALALPTDVVISAPIEAESTVAPPPRQFCTYFDSAYFERGIALYESLDRLYPVFTLWVLCLDEQTWNRMTDARLPKVRLIRIDELERATPGLVETRKTRSLVEYYFTCTPALPKYILDNDPATDLITYLDADLHFYANPEPLFTELGDRSVAIIRHKCNPLAEERFGIYNVGWVSFRRDERGLECLGWWLDRCLEWCFARSEDGKYADQKYLNSFPKRFEGVAVLEHPGANVAAWNVETSDLRISNNQPLAGDVPLLFFHFHGFRQIDYLCYETGFEIYGAPLTYEVRGAVIEPYVMALLRIAKRQMMSDGGSEGAVLPRRRELAVATVQLEGLQARGDEPVHEIAELQRRIRLLGQEIALLTEDLAVFARRIRFETAAAERLEALRCINYLLAGDQARCEELREEAVQLISRVTLTSQRIGLVGPAAAERLAALVHGNRLLIQEQATGAQFRRTVTDLAAELAAAQRQLDVAENAAAERLIELQSMNQLLRKEQTVNQKLREQAAQLTSEQSLVGQRLAVMQPAAAERTEALQHIRELLNSERSSGDLLRERLAKSAEEFAASSQHLALVETAATERLEALMHGNLLLLQEQATRAQLICTVSELEAELVVAQRQLEWAENAATGRLIALQSMNQLLGKEQAVNQELREQTAQLISEQSLVGQRLAVMEPAAAERAEALQHIRELLISERSSGDLLREKLAKLATEFGASSQHLALAETAAAERLEELEHLNLNSAVNPPEVGWRS